MVLKNTSVLKYFKLNPQPKPTANPSSSSSSSSSSSERGSSAANLTKSGAAAVHKSTHGPQMKQQTLDHLILHPRVTEPAQSNGTPEKSLAHQQHPLATAQLSTPQLIEQNARMVQQRDGAVDKNGRRRPRPAGLVEDLNLKRHLIHAQVSYPGFFGERNEGGDQEQGMQAFVNALVVYDFLTTFGVCVFECPDEVSYLKLSDFWTRLCRNEDGAWLMRVLRPMAYQVMDESLPKIREATTQAMLGLLAREDDEQLYELFTTKDWVDLTLVNKLAALRVLIDAVTESGVFVDYVGEVCKQATSVLNDRAAKKKYRVTLMGEQVMLEQRVLQLKRQVMESERALELFIIELNRQADQAVAQEQERAKESSDEGEVDDEARRESHRQKLNHARRTRTEIMNRYSGDIQEREQIIESLQSDYEKAQKKLESMKRELDELADLLDQGGLEKLADNVMRPLRGGQMRMLGFDAHCRKWWYFEQVGLVLIEDRPEVSSASNEKENSMVTDDDVIIVEDESTRKRQWTYIANERTLTLALKNMKVNGLREHELFKNLYNLRDVITDSFEKVNELRQLVLESSFTEPYVPSSPDDRQVHTRGKAKADDLDALFISGIQDSLYQVEANAYKISVYTRKSHQHPHLNAELMSREYTVASRKQRIDAIDDITCREMVMGVIGELMTYFTDDVFVPDVECLFCSMILLNSGNKETGLPEDAEEDAVMRALVSERTPAEWRDYVHTKMQQGNMSFLALLIDHFGMHVESILQKLLDSHGRVREPAATQTKKPVAKTPREAPKKRVKRVVAVVIESEDDEKSDSSEQSQANKRRPSRSTRLTRATRKSNRRQDSKDIQEGSGSDQESEFDELVSTRPRRNVAAATRSSRRLRVSSEDDGCDSNSSNDEISSSESEGFDEVPSRRSTRRR